MESSKTSVSGDGDNQDFAKELNKILEKSVREIHTNTTSTHGHGISEGEDDAEDSN